MAHRVEGGENGDRRLAQKVVLVTGASSGIGRAIAIACARAGADVAITYRRNSGGAEDTARAVQATGRRVELLRLDLGSPPEIEALPAALRRSFGRVDVWINNAGADILTGEGRSLPRTGKLDLVLNVDLRGTVLASWAASEMLQAQTGGGLIINMSWDHVTQGMAGENPGIYAVAKGGITSFSRALARDVAPAVRVNVLAPGFIATAFEEAAPEGWRDHVVDITPLRRWGTPEDVAGAAVYLASDAAAFLTGQVIMVNGGVVM